MPTAGKLRHGGPTIQAFRCESTNYRIGVMKVHSQRLPPEGHAVGVTFSCQKATYRCEHESTQGLEKKLSGGREDHVAPGPSHRTPVEAGLSKASKRVTGDVSPLPCSLAHSR